MSEQPRYGYSVNGTECGWQQEIDGLRDRIAALKRERDLLRAIVNDVGSWEQDRAEDRAAIREAPIDHDYMGGGRSGCSPACIGCTWEQKHAPAIARAQEGKS